MTNKHYGLFNNCVYTAYFSIASGGNKGGKSAVLFFKHVILLYLWLWEHSFDSCLWSPPQLRHFPLGSKQLIKQTDLTGKAINKNVEFDYLLCANVDPQLLFYLYMMTFFLCFLSNHERRKKDLQLWARFINWKYFHFIKSKQQMGPKQPKKHTSCKMWTLFCI